MEKRTKNFYKKYKYSSMKLYEDYPELYNRYIEETKFTKDENKLYIEYRKWLLSYCIRIEEILYGKQN